MIVLNRKRISVMLLVIMMGIFVFSYKTAEKEIVEEKSVTATPVSNKVIILDAGHGVPDEWEYLQR